jgi:hypothetical protein
MPPLWQEPYRVISFNLNGKINTSKENVKNGEKINGHF